MLQNSFKKLVKRAKTKTTVNLSLHMLYISSLWIGLSKQLKVLLFCFAESFSVDRPRKFELLSLCASKGSHRTCITTFGSSFLGWSAESIRQSKIRAPLQKKRIKRTNDNVSILAMLHRLSCKLHGSDLPCCTLDGTVSAFCGKLLPPSLCWLLN